jgi:hypothetical protein
MEPTPERARGDEDEDEPVPLFGSWRRIYGAVVACALIFMGLVALFSSWPF